MSNFQNKSPSGSESLSVKSQVLIAWETLCEKEQLQKNKHMNPLQKPKRGKLDNKPHLHPETSHPTPPASSARLSPTTMFISRFNYSAMSWEEEEMVWCSLYSSKLRIHRGHEYTLACLSFKNAASSALINKCIDPGCCRMWKVFSCRESCKVTGVRKSVCAQAYMCVLVRVSRLLCYLFYLCTTSMFGAVWSLQVVKLENKL